MPTFDDFAALLRKKEAIAATYAKHQASLSASWRRAEMRLFAKKFGPRAKFNWAKLNATPEGAAFLKDFEKRQIVRRFVAFWAAREHAVEEQLLALARAEDVVVPVTDEWTLINYVFVGTYSTQGYGAEKYAKVHANSIVDDAKHAGLDIKLEEAYSDAIGGRRTLIGWEVWAMTTPDGKELLTRKPGLPLREVVRRYWAQGCQPRVRFPSLPHDFEEKNGLDYFGN